MRTTFSEKTPWFCNVLLLTLFEPIKTCVFLTFPLFVCSFCLPGRSWGCLRHVGVSRAPSVLSRSSSWAPLGSPFPPRETLLAPFGRLLGLPFPLLRLSALLLGVSWLRLGASWLRLGASWLLLGGYWAFRVSSWVPLGCFRAFQKPTKTNVFLTFSLFVCSFCLPSRSWGCLRHFGVSRALSLLSLRSFSLLLGASWVSLSPS